MNPQQVIINISVEGLGNKGATRVDYYRYSVLIDGDIITEGRATPQYFLKSDIAKFCTGLTEFEKCQASRNIRSNTGKKVNFIRHGFFKLINFKLKLFKGILKQLFLSIKASGIQKINRIKVNADGHTAGSHEAKPAYQPISLKLRKNGVKGIIVLIEALKIFFPVTSPDGFKSKCTIT